MRNLILISIVLFIASCSSKKPLYKDSSAPIDKRVEDLLKRMTIEEKAAQLFALRSDDTTAYDADGNFVGKKDSAMLYHGAGGYYTPWRNVGPKQRALRINGLQKYMLEKTRLGIPVFTFSEALHGFMDKGATSFPQAIALGCTWDTALVEQVFTAASLEASSRGVRQVLSPVLDLARDPRWGRTEECYGEDPYLVSRIGLAAIYGLQGRNQTIDNEHVAVTLKHFAGHGQPEGGRNIAPVNFSEREFRSNHLYPFEMAVKRGNAQSIMASYNEWDGVPNHINYKLLIEILRNEWGFKGYVMSDGGGIDVVYENHHAAIDSAEAGILSIKAGLDYDLHSKGCFIAMAEQLRKGKIPESVLNRAVRNVLRVKFLCGMFDNPYCDVDKMEKVTNSAGHKDLARKAAQEAMVLLKNDNKILPLDSNKIKTLAVIGPNAEGLHLGGYSSVPHVGIDVLEGLNEFAGNKIDILYAEGCKLTLNKECHWHVNENPKLSDPEDDKDLINEAVNVAQRSDAVILVLGENEIINREAWSENHLGDRDDLDLVGMQNELAKAILETGKPVVVLLFNGRPVSINYLKDKAPVIIECWYLGQETGRAVTDVLFGKVNPGGKLTVTFPRSVGQLPCFYNHKPSRFREYVIADSSPLFPFGYGLSYTSFEYKNLSISPEKISPDGNAEVSVEVTNTGKVKGDEVVQLYIHDLVSLPVRPVMELKDFARISLNPGETKTVKFTITSDKLEAFNLNMKRVVEPGEFEIMVGKSSADFLKTRLLVK